MRPEWPKLEARRPDSEDGVSRRGSKPSSHQLEGLGEPQPLRVLMLFVFSDDLSCYGKSCVRCASVSFHSFLSRIIALCPGL